MRLKITLLFGFLLLNFFLSCSKDENADEIKSGGEVVGAQMVLVTIPNGVSLNNDYQGTINGQPVTLVKIDNVTLAFTMPNNLTVNEVALVIPGLSNMTVNYTVTQTVLTQTPDEVMASFVSNLNTCSQTLDTTSQGVNTNNSITIFKNYYANASKAEKESIAIAYKANKTIIDGILLNNLNFGGKNLVQETTTYIKLHKKNVAIMAIGVALATVNPFIGIPVAAVGAYRAYKANSDAIDNIFSTVSAKVDSWFTNKVGSAGGIVLENNIEKNVTFNFRSRKIIVSDVAKTDPLAVEYFGSYNLQNNYVTKENPIIDQFNSLKGTNYPHIENRLLPSTEAVNDVPADATRQQYLSIQSNSSSVAVVSYALVSGNLSIKVKYVGTPTSMPINTSLKFIYSDGFSSFKGDIPVEVSPSIVGNWKCESFENGSAVGTYFDLFLSSSCPNVATQAYTVESEIYTIGATNFSYTTKEKYKYYNKWLTNCTVTKDDPDTFETFNESSNGTYQYNAGTITAYPSGGSGAIYLSVQFLTPDKVKIDDKVYVRQ